MSYRQLFMVLVCSISFHYTQAQTDIEHIIESIASASAEETDYSIISERLHFYHKNPINLNKTNKEQLQELFLLNPIQISQLLNYRATNGPFINVLELQAIESIDPSTLHRLAPFVTTGASQLFKNQSAQQLVSRANHDILVRYKRFLEPQKGFNSSKKASSSYLGCPNHLLAHYKFNTQNIVSASVSMEKDAGEQFFAGKNQMGFDFYSANITINDWGKVKKLIVGDYALQFGEGLTLWSGLSFGKGADITTIAKHSSSIKPHTSFNEHSFFRGIATTIGHKSFSASPFISYKPIDASLHNEQINALPLSGLHRTPSEVNNKNSSNQFLFGSSVQYANKLFNAGITAYHSYYTHAFKTNHLPYNRFKFSGNRLTNLGINYNYTLHNTYLFGEIAHSTGSGYAFINGLMSALSPQVSLSLLHRSYQKNYHSFYNQALAEATTASNETGFYTGLLIKPNAKWEWFAYADVFQFSWFRLQADAPSKGHELLSQLSYQPNKKLKMIVRYRLKVKEENDKLKKSIASLEQVQKQTYRAEVHCHLNPSLLLRNRLELANYKRQYTPQPQWGYMLYQDVVYKPLQSKFSGNIRVAYFNIDHYNARIYAYENNILYGYTMFLYQNKGLRYYINGRYTLRKGVDLWCKYGLTYYFNKETVGSGPDQTQGNKRSEVHLQLRYQF